MKKKEKKILIIADAAWEDHNNIGNTFSNIFSKWDPDNLAIVYARPNLPCTDHCNHHFQISENRLLKSIYNRKIKTGLEVQSQDKIVKSNSYKIHNLEIEAEKGKKIYGFFTKFRLNIFLLLREFLWILGKWNTPELNDFIDDYSPDIIFSLASPNAYMNRIQRYCVSRLNIPHVIYFVDDITSFNQFSLNPMFWVVRTMSNLSIKNTLRTVSHVYTITDYQKQYLGKYFLKNISLLTKGIDIENMTCEFNVENYEKNKHLRYVFAGNIYAGRWNTLVQIARTLQDLGGTLDIYTVNKLTVKQKSDVENISTLRLKNPVKPEQVPGLLKTYDVLVHVESFNIKDRYATKMSFSTKIVDYMATGRPILAVGWEKSYSIKYLKEHGAANVITNIRNLKYGMKKFDSIEFNRELTKNAYDLLVLNHDIKKIQDEFKINTEILIQGDEL